MFLILGLLKIKVVKTGFLEIHEIRASLSFLVAAHSLFMELTSTWTRSLRFCSFIPKDSSCFAFLSDVEVLTLCLQMVSDITFGKRIRVALDIGCGVASFGAYLLSRNVLTMSVAPKDVHENQIQFALERGVPAMAAAFATRRLLYPSQAFDLIHCSRCRINWTRDGKVHLCV